MACREFEYTKVKQGGALISALQIKCAECPATLELVQTGSRRLPHEAAARKFRNHGWKVGSKPKGDLCPSCQLKDKNMAPKPDTPQPIVFASQKAEPPREMSRDERRIVFEKLNECYVGPEVGYDKGWSDEKVASDLGVPRAWIESVREEFFGPVAPAIDPAALADLKARAAEALKDAVADRKEIAALASRIDGRLKVIEAISRDIAKLEGRNAS